MAQKIIDKEILNTFPADSKSQDLNGLHWEVTDWSIGDPITEEKMDNTEQGLIIAFYKLNAILKEIGGALGPDTASDIQLNSSKIDILLSEIGGTLNGTTIDGSRIDTLESTEATQGNRIDALETKSSGIAKEIWGSDTITGTSRLDNIEEYDEAVEKALQAIKSEIGGTYSEGNGFTNSRIDSNATDIAVLKNKASALATELFGSDVTSGTSRIDLNENKIKAIAAELGGGTPDGSSASYPAAATRLDDLEKEIGGIRSTGNGYTNSRIDTLESMTSTHTTKLSAIATEIWGTDTTSGDSRIDKLTTELYGSNTTNYDSTSRLDSTITKLSTVTAELYGSDSTSVTSRLDDLEKEVGGARTSNGTGYTNSRIDTLESTSSSYGAQLTNIEAKNTAQDNKLAAIMSELGGTGNDGTNTTYGGTSRLDTVITEVWGSNTTSGNSRIDNIETHDTLVDEDIIAIKNELGDNRINSLEQKVGNGVIGTDSDISAAIRRLSDTVAGLDPTGSAEAISFLVSEVWGQSFSQDTDFTANSRIDNLETISQSLGTQLSTLATEQEELEQNLAATNAKIPIELYEATNQSASDTIVLNEAPHDKSIFFIAIPQGTLGTDNLTLQTNDIQFNNVIIKRTYNGSGMKIKYAPNSLISIYRNGSNAYAYNVPMVL